MAAPAAPEVTNRRYRTEDAPEVVAVLAAAFGRWPGFNIACSGVEHLRWQLAWLDACDKSTFVAEVEGRVAGVELCFTRSALMRGEDVTLAYATDSAVHPAFQGRGIYSTLRQLRIAAIRPDHDFVVTQPTHNAVHHTQSKEPIVRLGNQLTLFVKVLDVGRAAKATTTGRVLRHSPLARRVWFSALKVVSALKSAWRRQRTTPSWQVHEGDRFDDRVTAFWRDTAAPFDFIMDRSCDFLNWRYCDARSGGYTVLLAEEAGRLLGYAVLRAESGRGQIADLLALPGRDDIVESLLAAALDRLARDGAGEVLCWSVSSHPYNAALSRLGFLRLKRPRAFVFLPMRMDREQFAFLGDPETRVHLTNGDLI